jgi:hypothetical protein
MQIRIKLLQLSTTNAHPVELERLQLSMQALYVLVFETNTSSWPLDCRLRPNATGDTLTLFRPLHPHFGHKWILDCNAPRDTPLLAFRLEEYNMEPDSRY